MSSATQKLTFTNDAAEIERLHQLFAKQSEARWRVANTKAAERIAKLKKLREAILERREELCDAMHKDFRKHRAEVELTEIHPTIGEITHAMKHLRSWMRPRAVATPLLLTGARSEVQYEPRGHVAILSPWNYPFFLLVDPLVAAVAAGNVVIARPSEKTPATGAFIQKLIADVFDPAEVAVVLGGVELAEAMLELKFDHFFFTGSPRIGQKVMQAAAKHHASVTLELGGKSPAIVDDSAKLEHTAERLVWGKYINAGQTCVAPDYVLVHRSKEKQLLELMKGFIQKSYGATEAERKGSEDFCRIIDDAAFERVKGLLDRTVAAGAKVEIGGETDSKERYIAPTVLSGVKADMAIMSQEIFGPVLPVIAFDNLDDVIDHVSGGEKPLAMYLFSQKRNNLQRLLRETTAGGTCINNVVVHLGNPDLPFGGVGMSGVGHYHGHYGFQTFSHERAVFIQQRGAIAKLFAPPYRERLRNILELATKYVA
jgi:aldehyde dehydrogenase (NAD+)